MQMVPVESSHVATIGFQDGELRVRYKDGAEYGWPATAGEFCALLNAPSKGKWLRANLGERNGVKYGRAANAPNISGTPLVPELCLGGPRSNDTSSALPLNQAGKTRGRKPAYGPQDCGFAVVGR